VANKEETQASIGDNTSEHDILSSNGKVCIRAYLEIRNGDKVLGGWVLPGGKKTEDRKLAQKVCEDLSGNRPKPKFKTRLGMAGPYAVPRYV
jgi:hypothetical protein